MLTMNEYEPREALFEAKGMACVVSLMVKDEHIIDALDDIIDKIEWVLKNASIYKKQEVMKNE